MRIRETRGLNRYGRNKNISLLRHTFVYTETGITKRERCIFEARFSHVLFRHEINILARKEIGARRKT